MDWQPIETAPKDGTKILLFQPDVWNSDWNDYEGRYEPCVETGFYNDCGYPTGYYYPVFPINTPTHWMPLPSPPK